MKLKPRKTIALMDVDNTGFPNLALMKLSAYHKGRGDRVVKFNPKQVSLYDKVMASCIFTYAEIKYHYDEGGGAGIDLDKVLPDEIEHICPDYNLYRCKESYGFLTRGCIRNCDFCIVPKKEGKIRAHAKISEFLRHKHCILMDNNVIAHPHGIQQMEKISRLNIYVDFNQGIDCRLIDTQIATLLNKIGWIRYIRISCDSQAQKKPAVRALERLRAVGHTRKVYVNILVTEDIEDALDRVETLRPLVVSPYAMCYRSIDGKVVPTKRQKRFARWVNVKHFWHSVSWKEFEHSNK